MLIWFFQVFRVAAICAPHQSPAFKGCVTLMLRARGVVVNKRFIPFGKIDKYIYPNSHMFAGSTLEISTRWHRVISVFGT